MTVQLFNMFISKSYINKDKNSYKCYYCQNNYKLYLHTNTNKKNNITKLNIKNMPSKICLYFRIVMSAYQLNKFESFFQKVNNVYVVFI